MSEQNEFETHPEPPVLPLLNPASPTSGVSKLFSYFRRFLACNPFYLVSAALLLYGIYRASIDPRFLIREVSQLIFNFSSLQLYEFLLVAVAIVLARRRIWYDSTLLMVLENMLIF